MQYLLALTLLLAPTYAVRFNFFGFPANFLMLWVGCAGIIFLCWLLGTGRVKKFLLHLQTFPKIIRLALFTFFVAGFLSLFVGGFSLSKFGQFIVLFLEPISVFFIARFLWQEVPRAREWFIHTAFFFVGVAGLYAVIQYFTLIGLPQDFWGNSVEPKRAIAFFSHPNFYALFVAPLLAFLFPRILEQVGKERRLPLAALAWLLGGVGLLLSLSRGGWAGLAVSVAVAILLVATKQQRRWIGLAASVAVVVVLLVPNFRYRILLPFQGEKSSVARVSLWNTGWSMVQDSPFLGKGLLGFSNNWYAYNTDPGLEHYPAPHNIFLNFWVDTGLLGLLSFVGLCAFALRKSFRQKNNAVLFGIGLALIAMAFHGLIDIPYLKNDLALEFWLFLSLIL